MTTDVLTADAREHVQAVMYDSEFEGLLDALPESLPGRSDPTGNPSA